MQDHYAEIVRLGGEVLVVSFAEPETLKLHLAGRGLPFPVFADSSRTAYRAFGLERTSWRAILRVQTISRYLRLVLSGWLPRRPREGEDVLQLGGDFVLDRNGRIVYAYRSAEPTDRPLVRELVEAIRAASAAT